MTTIDRPGRMARFTARRNALLVAGLCAAVLAPTGPVAGQRPVPGDVLLDAPTGSRIGVAVAEPAAPPDATTLQPLDTYGRSPGLRIRAVDPDTTWAAWLVEATSATDPAAGPLTLAAGVAEVPLEIVDLDAPPPGDWRVVATLTSGADATDTTWAWRLIVPDRTLPETFPAPDLVLFGGGGTVLAERGSGCFLGTCGDIGRPVPDRALPAIRLGRPDEPIALSLSDGGRMARVTAVATLLDAGQGRLVTLLELELDPVSHVVLVPPPGPGRWRLELLVVHADERGHQSGSVRATVPPG